VIGGVEAILQRHAELLADHGYSVRVIAGRGEAWDPRIPLDLLPLLDSRHPEILAAKLALDAGHRPEAFEPLAGRIRSALAEPLRAIDLLVAHNVCSLHKNLPLTAALQAVSREEGRPRLMLWHHDLAWTASAYQDELHPGWPWDLISTDWGAEHVVVSEHRRRELIDLMDLDPARVRVVPNGIDVARQLNLSEEAQAIADRFNLLEADPILLSPVRITRRKNLELALRTCAVLQEAFPQVVLLVTGPPGAHNPENRAYLEELQGLRAELGLQGRIHFLADGRAQPLSTEAVGGLFRLADALLLPSREEGFGLPMLEASLARLPIFCSDIPALRALGAEGAEYFSPDASPGDVAQRMAARLSADRAHSMAVRVRQSYDWQRIFVEQIEPLVQR
jgi:glycosyltransferase involved in cell wall biosynthesis